MTVYSTGIWALMNSLTEEREKESIENSGLWTQLLKWHMCIAWHLATCSQVCSGLLALAHTTLCGFNEVVCIKFFEPNGESDYLATKEIG